MKSIKQKLRGVLFDIDFSSAIKQGIRDYNLLCGYKLNEQPGSETAEDRKANRTTDVHQQLTVENTEGLKVTG